MPVRVKFSSRFLAKSTGKVDTVIAESQEFYVKVIWMLKSLGLENHALKWDFIVTVMIQLDISYLE